jgi:uncharacterized membrane protein (DUF373 family)
LPPLASHIEGRRLQQLVNIRWSHVAVLLISGIAFSLSFRLNQLLDDYFVYSQGISLLFIPAGVKLLLVLVGRLPAVIGILIVSVHLGAGIWPDKSMVTVFNFAFVSLMTYPLATYVVLRLLGIRRDLHNLRYWHIVALSLAASVLNGIVHNIDYLIEGVSDSESQWSNTAAMVLGDFLGCFVAVSLFHTATVFLSKQTKQ